MNCENVPRISLPFYRALIIRKQYRHLTELIDKSRQIYNKIDPGAVYTSTNSTWTFSSGAKIQFKYIEKDTQVEELQGQSFEYIAVDEIGQYQSDYIFKYCLSRLRSSAGLKCYMRSTSNPSRYRWLREFFRIGPSGESTKFTLDFQTSSGVMTKEIQYIQAKITDNPYIGADYEAMLQLLPEDERKALLEGDWWAYDNVDGQVYETALKEFKKRNGLCRCPYDENLKTYAFIDLGMSDSFVILFVQIFGKEIRIIDFLEANGKSIPDYCTYISQKPYKLERIYLPHDASVRELGTGISRIEQFQKHISCDVEILPRLQLEEGIMLAKDMFKNVWIDVGAEEVLRNLEQYHRKKDNALNLYTKPIHDKHSHIADAFRYISYALPELTKPKVELDIQVRRFSRF